MDRKHIAVLRGGPSSEYEVSLKTGRSVLNTLKGKHRLRDIIIDKNGNWIVEGLHKNPSKALYGIDVVFNAMHGEYGEDGKVQQILENLNIPFTGSTAFGSAISMNKVKSKRVYLQNDIPTPLAKVVSNSAPVDEIAYSIFRAFPMPVILKPINSGSSVDVFIIRDFNSLLEGLLKMFEKYEQILMEEYIYGKEATVGVLENFRDQQHYAFMPIEIRHGKDIFDYDAKYCGSTEELCPGNFSYEEKSLLQDLAIKAHQNLNLRHYSRTDFIINPKRGIFVLETNSLPGLTEESLYSKALKPSGSEYEEFLGHLINLAHGGR